MARMLFPALVVAAVFGGTLVGDARAQGTGRAMDFGLSIPAAGMGGASNASCWGDLDYWANPALLGYARGMRYLHTSTALVPNYVGDVVLSSDALQWGGGGLGIVLSGRPWDIGGVRLDYGQSEGRDENGNFTGTFGSYETVDSWARGSASHARSRASCASAAVKRPGGAGTPTSRRA